MRQKNQQGFTLLELLVVTAVIGCLAAIAIPQFASYRDKAERSALLSDGRSLYRAFIVFYIENSEYPYKDPYPPEPPMQFNVNSFAPLTLPNYMGGSPFDIDVELFRDRLDGRKAESFDSPDDMGPNQEFYVVMGWAKDPTTRLVVAQADNVLYADGTTQVDSGNWLDGVYIADENGTLTGR